MKFLNAGADAYVPDGSTIEEALMRTTYLSIGTHQDDCEIMAYHAISQCYESEENWFTAVVLTDGSGSPRSGEFANYTNEQIHMKRSAEQRVAADVGKYSAVIQLCYTSEDVRTKRCADVEGELIRIISQAKPKYIFTHNPIDRHETHLGACIRIIHAIRKTPRECRPEKVYGMEVWRSLDWLSDRERLLFDTSRYPNIENGVITAYDSQCTPLKRFDLAAIGRRLGNATFQAPRDNDTTNSCSIGMDLTPLIEDETLDIREFALAHIDRFYQDAKELLDAFI